jgi:two-component system, cell cycle response regulator
MKQTSTVLIVDDQKAIRETIALMLSNQGYRLEFAGNGADAIEKAARVLPDLILLDIMMPGMDGFQVCQQLRAHPILAQVPIVMVTALADRHSWIKGIEVGADDFVFKPFDTTELCTRVQNITQLNRYRRLLVERLKFEWVIRNADDGYAMLDAKGYIVYANARARLFLGLTMQEKAVIKDRFIDLIREEYHLEPRDAWVDWPQKSSATQTRYLIRPETINARSFWLRVNTLCLPPDMDVATVVRLHNVTEQMVLQSDIWRFQSMIFHKLRTPLISIMNGLELLVRHSEQLSRVETRDLTQGAYAGAQRLKGDLEDVLHYLKAPTMAQSGAGFSLAQLEKLILKIATDLVLRPPAMAGQEQVKKLRLTLTPEAVSTVLWEVIENAKKFHPQHDPDIQIFTFRPNAKELTIWIGDNGVNLSPEQLAQVWTPYYQGEKQFTGEVPGMGLGLAMVAALIWGVGGTCRMYNRATGSGVVVELVLPVQGAENNQPLTTGRQQPALKQGPPAGKKVVAAKTAGK